MGKNQNINQIGKPHFLGIGAPRTGTTWLSHCLSKHSQIYIPPTEPGSKYELHYFNSCQNTTATFLRRCFRTLPRLIKEKIKGTRVEDPGQILSIIRNLLPPQSALFVPCNLLIFLYKVYRNKVYRKMMRRNTGNLRWIKKYYLGRLYLNPENWYASLFETTGQQICGEITPMYGLLPDSSIEYMQSFNKDMRFIYLIRNPIEREWSNISLLTMNPGSSLPMSVVQKWDHRLQAFNDYLSTLKKYLKYVAPENLFLGFYEDIMFNQDRFLATVQEFLGVSIENISRKPQYTGGYKNILTEYAVYLAQKNIHKIEEMASVFWGYTQFWLDVASELCKTDTTSHSNEMFISTPFAINDQWSSRWERPGAKKFQSGPLSRLPCVNKLIP